MPRITSRDNPRLKEAVRLIASSRERRKAGRCGLEGEHIVPAYCRAHGPAETLLIAETALDRPAIRALQAIVPAAQTLVVAPAAWADFSQLPATVGALAVVPPPTPRFAQVFLSAPCAVAWSPKVLGAAQGAHFPLEIYEDVDLPQWAGRYEGKVA